MPHVVIITTIAARRNEAVTGLVSCRLTPRLSCGARTPTPSRQGPPARRQLQPVVRRRRKNDTTRPLDSQGPPPLLRVKPGSTRGGCTITRARVARAPAAYPRTATTESRDNQRTPERQRDRECQQR